MATFKEPVKTTDTTNGLSACTATVSTGGAGSGSVVATPAISIVGTPNAATGNLVTLTNASHGQATTYTIRDRGAAGNLVTSGTMVSGNLAQSNGAGDLVDSTITASSVSGLITQVGNVTTISVTLNTAAVTGAFATPVQLIAAPGSGKVIIIQEAIVYTNSTGQTAFATGGNAIIQYGNTVHGAGTNCLTTTIAAANITAASSQVLGGLIPTTTALTAVSNLGVFFSNATGAFTNGTGSSLVISLTYQTITATV